MHNARKGEAMLENRSNLVRSLQRGKRRDPGGEARKAGYRRLIAPMSLVYGHITLNTPVLVRSLKLSKVELR